MDTQLQNSFNAVILEAEEKYTPESIQLSKRAKEMATNNIYTFVCSQERSELHSISISENKLLWQSVLLVKIFVTVLTIPKTC